MRAIRWLPLALGLALGLAALLMAGSGSAEPVQRLEVFAGHPLPQVGARLYEDPACATHGLLWQAGWFTAADASRWLWSHAPGAAIEAWSPPALEKALEQDDRAQGAAAAMATHAATLASDASGRADAWLLGAEDPVEWGLLQANHEDECVLRLAEITTGL